MPDEEWLRAWARENKVLFNLPLVLWDLDSTLARTLRRRHMVQGIKAGNGTWEDYSMACASDTPITENVALMRMLSGRFYSHVAVSGRSRCSEKLTRAWCAEHDVPLQGFILQPDGASMPNAEWKTHVARFLQGYGRVALFVEDRVLVAMHLREALGIPVLCVDPCEPVEPKEAL